MRRGERMPDGMADGKIRKKIIEKEIEYSVEPDDMHSVFTVERPERKKIKNKLKLEPTLFFLFLITTCVSN